jgi:hypothetical protein
MTASLNEAYGVVRKRQLRTLERNQRVQLGLRAGATDSEVAEALASRPIPGFRPGDPVSYWDPEIADKAIEPVMPKKLQYRWTGPHLVEKREGDHYYIARRGKSTLASPGRLRAYETWCHEPVVEQPHAEDQAPESKVPELGQMVVVPLETRVGRSRPFAVGKITAVRRGGAFLIHWFGNPHGQMEGAYRPAWRVRVADAGQGVTYSAEQDLIHRGAAPRTSDTENQIIRSRNITHWGFQLQHNDRLPTRILRAIHKDPRIGWEIPKK